ncbi:MAG TPA: biotin/lipoyl-binding protein [Bacteroidales bacterium]|nr:biotin/lipoyl-binding protein [Bacteroidales bacterium]
MKKYKFTINDKDYSVVINDIENDVADVEVNGTAYSIKLNQAQKTSKTPILIRKEVQNKPGENKVAEKLAPMPITAKPSSKTINAPLPGSILKINFKEGDSFNEGDVLMVMESMKMENNVLAERAGTVVRVCTAVGETVMQDDALFEIQ